ncbi:MAG: hypothetical protein AB1597_07120 [Chloroflexota bacterium]
MGTSFNLSAVVSHIDANRSVKELIMARIKRQGQRQRISVTDLTSLKQAYFKRKFPDILPPLERQQLMWSGTGFHQLFGAAVSREEYLEQFVEVDGVVGRIDIYEDIPTEIKTTGSLVDEGDIKRKRPYYLEQLGFYCAMVNNAEGRVVIYQRSASPEQSLAAFRVTFSDLSAIITEMRRRRDLLLEALEKGDPSRLPVCPWGNWQCDYSTVCDCRASMVPASKEVLAQVSTIEADEAAVHHLVEKLAAKTGSVKPPRLNDLVFPRKAYLARIKQRDAHDEEAIDTEEEAAERLVSMERTGFLGVIRDAVKYGLPGETQHVPLKSGPLEDMLLLNDGMPIVVRNARLNSVVERSNLPRVFSHYIMRLAMECGLTNQRRGRLIVYYEKVLQEDAKLMVYDISFKDTETLKAEALRRLNLLETANQVDELPACPDWMCRYCRESASCSPGADTA